MASKSVLEELVDLYCRLDRIFCEDPGDDRTSDDLCELAAAIAEIARPRTVGEAMALPNLDLRCHALTYLIRTDAAATYDQVEGFLDLVMDQMGETLTEAQADFDGLQLCEWLEQASAAYEVQEEAEAILAAAESAPRDRYWAIAELSRAQE